MTMAPHDGGLSVRGLHAAFGRREVLRGVDLDVAAGETLVLFGPSGAGKTVLLRAIAGLEPAARCRVLIDGIDVTHLGPDKRGIGMAFQNFALYPHMRARENIASPLQAGRVPAAEAARRVADVAALLRITHVLDHMPRALSNGQKQRTALARAVVGAPRVLLLDDPLRNVDAKLRYEMRLELPRLLRRARAATIYVSQDYREAMALGDRVAILLDGRIVQQGPPEEVYDAPRTVQVARLFGDPPINLLACAQHADAASVEAAGLHFRLASDLARRPARIGVRPEAISVSAGSPPGAAPATIVAITPLHERLVVLLRTPAGVEVVASVTGAIPAEGQPVWFAADPDRVLFFDEAGAVLDQRTVVANGRVAA